MKKSLPLFDESEDQLEGEQDIPKQDPSNFSPAVVSGSDWTTETILTQIEKGNILLNPSFQRRDAWDRRRKSRFIESLILGFPVPQLVFADSKERRGSYIVLDGKQRLLSLRQFAAARENDDFDQLKLIGLEIREDLNGKSLADIRLDPRFRDDITAFENQPIRTVILKNWQNENFLFSVFLRLNTGSVSLSPQELRQALHPGPFVSFLDIESGNSSALRDILGRKEPDFRMRDAELLLRYFAFKNFVSSYSGNLKLFLDNCCKQFNEQWNEQEQMVKEQLVDFELAHQTIKRVFARNAYRKWVNGEFETRFNRAIFDVMILAFSRPEVRDKALNHEKPLEQAFKKLCSEDSSFLQSIETTTKSLGATFTRFSRWFRVVNQELKVNIPLPQFDRD